MFVKSIYPNCNLKNGVRVKKGVDAFWVECLPNEVQETILPLASQKEKERITRLLLAIQTIPMEDNSRGTWKSATEGYCNCNHIYFLIFRNLESIMLFPWFYPIAGHWGSYSPFINIRSIEIKSLIELEDMKIPTIKVFDE